MLLLFTVILVLVYEITLIYRPEILPSTLRGSQIISNCVNEKWGLLYDTVRDKVFGDNYRYHVNASDPQAYEIQYDNNIDNEPVTIKATNADNENKRQT